MENVKLKEIKLSQIAKENTIEGIYINQNEDYGKIGEDEAEEINVTGKEIFIKLNNNDILKVWISEWGGINYIVD